MHSAMPRLSSPRCHFCPFCGATFVRGYGARERCPWSDKKCDAQKCDCLATATMVNNLGVALFQIKRVAFFPKNFENEEENVGPSRMGKVKMKKRKSANESGIGDQLCKS